MIVISLSSSSSSVSDYGCSSAEFRFESDYGTVASLNCNFRSLIRSGELYTAQRRNGVVEHWVYFSCQQPKLEAFDPARLHWILLPRMTPNNCFVHFSNKESLGIGMELLVCGKDVWPMSFIGTAYSRKTCDSQGEILSSAELYNSETGTWRTLRSMNKQHKMCSGEFMDGKFYVIGGIGGADSKLLRCAEEYDLEMGT
ncbi:F-box/kelch-repeat protein SKIP11 [Capsicum baccatum]|uniref:F-box/kelch-repeat protein SKIP11 n=1 Tax=Capsicum baccatum TaxID=33114 RepID=A0A2G2VLS1_CAPBA|nr:F-box/kelch-repeat protein SKIP11 [Capsicum baccatum]